MTTGEPDPPLTAADLLFGSAQDAPKTLTSHIMSAGQTKSMGRALTRLPRVTREAAAAQVAAAAVGLLRMDLGEMLVAGWREHREIIAAARRTLATPASQELVGLGAHRITTIQQPAVGILLDGRRVHTLQLGVSIIFDVTAMVAGVSVGRLSAVHSGRCDVGVALTIHDVEVLTKRAHLELPGLKTLRSGVRLLPASEYPDSPDDLHPAGLHPAGLNPGGLHPGGLNPGGLNPASLHSASQFPAVELPGPQGDGPQSDGLPGDGPQGDGHSPAGHSTTHQASGPAVDHQ